MKLKCLFSILFLGLFLSCSSDNKDNEEIPQTPNILFLIADDWSYPHAGIYGDPVVRTPTFDRLAREGALFHHAYCTSPSCSPSRASILTGRFPHQNESAGNLWSVFPNKFDNYVSILANEGYHTGSTRKGWAPGNFLKGGYAFNPAGKKYVAFEEFYKEKEEGQAFCFWFGSSDPHREYRVNSGIETGMKLEDVIVPEFMPDVDCVRNDMLDYYFEVERFDRECGQILDFLEANGELENTIVVMTSDNGMPFPRAKANLYDYGTRMPLAIRWPLKVSPGIEINQFISFTDFAPSFLNATGIEIPHGMTGKAIWEVISGKEDPERNQVFIERERHANVRKGDLSYPMRAIRTHDYLYIRNLIPDRWPAGDPEVHQSVGQFGDIDNSISKYLIESMKDSDNSTEAELFNLVFGKRPSEELYNVQLDPYNLNNLVETIEYQAVRDELSKKLEKWMQETGDPRFNDPGTIYWDTVLYTPNYQHRNYDVSRRIYNYRINPVLGEEIPCRSE